MRGANPASLAQILVAVGIERKHTKFGNVYRVVKIGEERTGLGDDLSDGLGEGGDLHPL